MVAGTARDPQPLVGVDGPSGSTFEPAAGLSWGVSLDPAALSVTSQAADL